MKYAFLAISLFLLSSCSSSFHNISKEDLKIKIAYFNFGERLLHKSPEIAICFNKKKLVAESEIDRLWLDELAREKITWPAIIDGIEHKAIIHAMADKVTFQYFVLNVKNFSTRGKAYAQREKCRQFYNKNKHWIELAKQKQEEK